MLGKSGLALKQLAVERREDDHSEVVMVLGGDDPLTHLDGAAELLVNLTGQRRLGRLPRLELSAGELPEALKASGSPFCAEDAALVDDDGTDDLDALFGRLQAGGVEVLEPPTDQFWGVRDCALRDPSGNVIRIDQN